MKMLLHIAANMIYGLGYFTISFLSADLSAYLNIDSIVLNIPHTNQILQWFVNMGDL